jgi:cytidylate kinase
MSIITISRGSYSRGKEVAEMLAKKLGYDCIARRILLEASKEFNIPEIKLTRALHDSPSLLNRVTHGKEKYVAFIEHALLQHIVKDNIVYHGLAGQFLIKDIPHVLKVRIIADLEDRISEEVKREGITEKEARMIITKDDQERRNWSRHLYGIDTWDAQLYDLVLHIGKLTTEEAVEIICQTVSFPSFKPSHDSDKILDNRLLASKIKTTLINKYPTIAVSCNDGEAFLISAGAIEAEHAMSEDIKARLKNIPGIKRIVLSVTPATIYK